MPGILTAQITNNTSQTDSGVKMYNIAKRLTDTFPIVIPDLLLCVDITQTL